jgi:cytochrome b561
LIFLHWAIAVLIFVQIGLGYYFNQILPDHSAVQARVQGVHASLGVTTLILVLARVLYRAMRRVPPLPGRTPQWEAGLVRSVHIALYGVMVALPVTGWLMLTIRHIPISLWGLPLPPAPHFLDIPGPHRRPVLRALQHLHVFTLVWIALAMIGLHVAGVIKRQVSGHPILSRMAPVLVARPER